MFGRVAGRVVVCAGAVIGAGFASGREVVAFFSRYGQHAWWLILVSCAVMAGLCGLCLTKSHEKECWAQMLCPWARLCTIVLMIITGGAMIAAAGHMVQLVWAHPKAYWLGALAALLTAWAAGFSDLRPLSWLGGLLTAVFVFAVAALLCLPASQMIDVHQPVRQLGRAALRCVGYAAMNITLAMGVICRCAQKETKQNVWLSFAFGALMALLLGMSHMLYSRHPQLLEADFPMVMLLSLFGRGGFLLSAGLMYLSVLTTLASVLDALRRAACTMLPGSVFPSAAALAAPALMSAVGFSGIVDHLYAPAGLVCMGLVFAPLGLRGLTKDG